MPVFVVSSTAMVQCYGESSLGRYPNPSSFLPIPVDLEIFYAWQEFSALGLKVRMDSPPMANRNTRKSEENAELARVRQEVIRKVMARIPADGLEATAIPGLSLYRRSEPTACNCVNYQPELIVFLQGEKRIQVGGATHVCDGSTFLLTSIDLPVTSQVTRASNSEPILGMILKLEMPLVREILSQEEFAAADFSRGVRGMAVGVTTVEMLDVCSRMLGLLDRPGEIGFLGGLLHRELLYRLLRGPQGRHLRAIATLGDQTNRTAKAVAWLKANFNKPLRIEDMATIAQMGVSTFHHHFRSLTQMSPLQYQKQLRLQAARDRMLNQGMDAASAAFEVGYESASQFNREYSRFFGQPPMRDVRAMRITAAADVV
jgi:AraC-like DNA-binding protein